MTQDSLPIIIAEDLSKKEWRRYQHTEPITKILPLQTSTSGSNKLISISKDASVKVYRGSDYYPLQTLNITTTPSTSSTPVWPSDAALLTLGGHQRLVVSSYDRCFAFYNVLLAENGPERPEERSCLGLGGILKIPAPFHAATALGSLPFYTSTKTSTSTSNTHNNEEQHLVYGDDSGKVQLIKATPPTMGSSAILNMKKPDAKTDVEQLHTHHSASITQLMHVPHVGLLSSSLDGTIGIFDAERGRIAGTTGNLHNGTAVRCMAYHHPLTLAVSGGAGRSALLWHPRGDSGNAVGELPGHVNGVLSICTGHMGLLGNSTGNASTITEHMVVTLSGVGTMTVFDLRTLRPLHKLEGTGDYSSHEDARPTAMAFDQERQRLITATKRPCAWSFSSSREGGKGQCTSGGESFFPNSQGCHSSPSTRITTKAAKTDTETVAAAEVEQATELNMPCDACETAPSFCSFTPLKTKVEDAPEKEEIEVYKQAYSHLRTFTIPDVAACGGQP